MLRCYYHNCICIFTDVLNNCILYVYFYKQYCVSDLLIFVIIITGCTFTFMLINCFSHIYIISYYCWCTYKNHTTSGYLYIGKVHRDICINNIHIILFSKNISSKVYLFRGSGLIVHL
jgi:hypothetical protein